MLITPDTRRQHHRFVIRSRSAIESAWRTRRSMSLTQSTPSDIVDQHRHRLEMGWLVPVVIACILGITNSFGPTLSSSFSRMQADPIDSRFNHYVLEHGYRIIRHTETAGTFWSPGFFFPTRGMLAYSDNLIGSAPVYWIWRLMFDPEAAFSLWMISCCILNFASFAAFGRRLRLHPCLIAAGAMIFAFGFHRSMLIKHQQMLPHFFLPLAIWAAWEWSRRPTLWKVAAVAVCIYLQLLCGIYLGWFLLFSLLILLPLLIIRHEPRREALRFLRERWLSTGVVVVVFVGVMGATFWPYLGQHHGSAEYDWHEVQVYLPTARTFLPPWGLSDTTTSEAYFAAGVRPTLPLAGFVFSAGIVVLLFSMKRLLRAPDENASLAAAALIAGIVMALLSIRWGSSFSLWRIVYTIVPGAKGIRAVSRIDLTVFSYLALAITIGVDRIVRGISSLPRRHSAAIVISLVLCAEQCVKGLPSFEVRPWEADVQQLSDLMKSGGDVAYVQYYTSRNHADFMAMEVSAMWAGLEANKPVVNGYSGAWPEGYQPKLLMQPSEMQKWLSQSPSPPATLNVITPKQPGFPREWSDAFPEQSIWTTNDFVGGTFKLR
jgi:hypothetical protein